MKARRSRFVSLFDKREQSLQERFEKFDRENPEVYRALVSIARRYRVAGRRRCSMDMLMHVLRFETAVNMPGESFKCNNDYVSRYARKMVAEFPNEFEGFFSFRKLSAA